MGFLACRASVCGPDVATFPRAYRSTLYKGAFLAAVGASNRCAPLPGRVSVAYHFNPPPTWPKPAPGWVAPPGWQPDPSWPPPAPGWQLWIEVPDPPTTWAMPSPLPAPLISPPAAEPRSSSLADPAVTGAAPVSGVPFQPGASSSVPSAPAVPVAAAKAASPGLFGRRKQAEADAEHARAESEQAYRQFAAQAAHAAALQADLNRVLGLDAGELARETEAAQAELGRLHAEAEHARAAQALEAAHAAEQLAAERGRALAQLSAEKARALEETHREIALAQQLRETALHDAAALEGRLAQAREVLVATEEAVMLQEAGIYAYRHPLADAVAYKSKLADLSDKIKSVVRTGNAVDATTNWTVNQSASQGRKMVADFSKLMLRAYNAEADYAVRSMRPHRLDSLVERLEKSRSTIARLGATMNIRITDGYHRLRVKELELTADFLAKQDEERERRRELREAQREEEKLQREIERERARLAKERAHHLAALARLRASGTVVDASAEADLEAKLSEIVGQLAAVDAREANIRAGYVYVISNIGAFGENMVKIGMTRRLEPMDRVHELGDASVPFRFDVHALIFSEDAVGLERRLHKEFEAERVNRVNMRREFFRTTPAAVRDALTRIQGQHLLEFHEEADAPEWRASHGPDPARESSGDTGVDTGAVA
jgi:Domain of unknown function (DUF4041)/T5orf172 domain